MKVRFTQLVDYWIGVPLCLLVSLWALVVRAVAGDRRHAPRRILFIELSEMGSAILAYSALVRAGRMVDPGQVYFLIFDKNAPSVALLDLLPRENILTIREDSFTNFARSAWTTLRQIRRLGIDTVIDLELFSRFTALMSFATGATTRVGYDNWTSEGLFRGRLLTHRVLYNHHQHMALNFLALVLALEAPADQVPLLKRDVRRELLPLPRRRSADADRDRLFAQLVGEYPTLRRETPLVIVNPDPGPLLPIRGWPIDRYAELVRRVLAAEPRAVGVVIGLAESRPIAERILAVVGRERCIDFTGKTASLADLVTLLELGRVLVTNDSGPAHFASLTDIRTFVLFGPETPALYAPLGEQVTSISAYLACSPCLAATNHRHTPCTDNQCMQAITVEHVLGEVMRALQAAPATGVAAG